MFSLAGDIFSGHQGASNMFDSNGRNNTTYDMYPDWCAAEMCIRDRFVFDDKERLLCAIE